VIATIKALHYLALAFGAGASFGNIFLMLAAGPHDLPDPGRTAALRKLYRTTALGAIAVLWLTGLVLLVFRHGGWVAGYAFGVKIALVAVLTAIILFLNLMAPRWARRGGPPGWVANLHVVATFCLLSAIVLAAYAFG
jgi:hypothetical protein